MSATVVVVNATYEPLSRTTVSRAISLVLAGKAVIEEADPLRRLRHMAGEMLWPKVVRLIRYVRVPYRYGVVPWSKAGVLKRDNQKCAYCAKKATTVDHVLPQAKGGKNTWMNTVAACLRCNNEKADMTPEQAKMPLLFEPSEPRRIGFLGV